MSYTNYANIADFCKAKTTEDFLYLENENETKSIQDILNEVKKHFGEEVDLNDIIISASYEQFRAYGYDLYDPSDYATVLIIYRKKS